MDISHVMHTCRLLALTTDDYEGNAIQLLKENMANNTFVVDKGSSALEFRALMFLARLASTALLQYKVSPKEEYDRLIEMNKEHTFRSRDWVASHLRLGEMQVRF
jgi:hypothetical protein